MKKIKKTGNFILFFLVFSISVKSQVNVANTAVKKETASAKSVAGAAAAAAANELVGYWKMIPLPNPSINKVNPWPQKYQWFEFTKDGKINSVMMESDNKEYTSSELKTIFDVFSSNEVPNYKIQEQFVTIDNPKIKNYLEIWGTNIFDKDIAGVAKKEI